VVQNRNIAHKYKRMLSKIDHIGVAVKDAEKSQLLFDLLFGKQAFKTEEVASEGVRTIFYQLDDLKIELLESLSEENAIHKFLEKRGEGIHHIAYEVEDIKESMETFRDEGFRLLNEHPKLGADNKLICFIHPKDTNGILIELCQSQKEKKKEDEKRES